MWGSVSRTSTQDHPCLPGTNPLGQGGQSFFVLEWISSVPFILACICAHKRVCTRPHPAAGHTAFLPSQRCQPGGASSQPPSSSGKPALKNNLSLFLFFGGGRRNVDHVLFQFLKLFSACVRVFLISSQAAFGNLHVLQIFFFF